jgi:hypothetical protein
VATVWAGRSDRYSDERSGLQGGREKIEMSYIGG